MDPLTHPAAGGENLQALTNAPLVGPFKGMFKLDDARANGAEGPGGGAAVPLMSHRQNPSLGAGDGVNSSGQS